LCADPKRKVVSFWTMRFNHVRAVWGELCYNLHLLTGKIAEPGCGPFSLTGPPSACRTAREVGTFAHRLPADMVVVTPEHRKHVEEVWPTCSRWCRTRTATRCKQTDMRLFAPRRGR